MPSVAHSRSQTQLILELGGFVRRSGGRPGGWWLLTEILRDDHAQGLTPDSPS